MIRICAKAVIREWLNNMTPKTPEESKIYAQMMDMLADQFYHQKGDNITVNRMELADMLTKQTLHGMSLEQ